MVQGIINPEFENENESRLFPVDDQATFVDNLGVGVAMNLVVDCRLWVPDYGTSQYRVYLGGITVSNALVSTVFMLTDGLTPVPPGGPIDDTPAAVADRLIASAVAMLPVEPGRMYPITGLVSGVGGWIAFGSGVNRTTVDHRFSSHRQAVLTPSCVNAYKPATTTSIGRYDSTITLNGLVVLRQGRDLLISREQRTIDGMDRTVVCFRLNPETAGAQRNKAYIGPCLGRPEADTCGRQPIMTINNVAPDCNGNIELDVDNVSIRQLVNDKGLVLQTTTGLDEFCQSGAGPIVVYPSHLTTPYLESFFTDLPSSATQLGDFTFRDGEFLQDRCRVRSASIGRAVATLAINSMNRVLGSDVMFPAPYQGVYSQHMYFVFGWQSVESFWFAGLERASLVDESDRLVIGRVAGSNRLIESQAAATLPINSDTYYGMQLTITKVTTTSVRLDLETDVGDLTFSTSLVRDGWVGFTAEQSFALLDNFRVDWADAYPAPGACEYYYGYPN